MSVFSDLWVVEIDGKNLSTGAIETFSYSTFGYKTRPEDTPPSLLYESRLLDVVSLQRSIFSGGSLGGAAVSSYGSIRLDATDRGDGNGRPFDDWISTHSFDGQEVRSYMLQDPTESYDTLTRRVTARIRDKPRVGLDEAVFRLRDLKDYLDIEVQTPLYSGGEDGIRFSGGNGRATIVSSAELDLTGDMAYMVRIKPDVLANYALSGWRGGTRAPWKLDLRSGGELRFVYSHSGGTVASQISTITYEALKLQDVGFRISGDQLTFFVRNMEDRIDRAQWSDTAFTLDAATRDAAVGSQFYIGATAGSFDGLWSEHRVWDGSGGTDYRRLMEQRFWANDIPGSDAFKGGAGTIVGYHKADEGAGATLTDASASGNDLTLAGGYAWQVEALGGGEDLAGESMPLCLGESFRINPTLLLARKSLFQISARAIEAVTDCVQNGGDIAAEDVGGTWTDGGDTGPLAPYDNNAPDLATFLAHTVASGGYIVYLPMALLRTAGDVDDGGIRVNVKGDNVGGYVDDIDELIERLNEFGPLAAADIDMAANGFAAAVHGKPAGLYIPAGSKRKLSDWHNDLLLPRGMWYPARGNGKLSARILASPESPADHELGEEHLSDKREPVAQQTLAPPTRGHKIGYAKTEDTLNEGAIAGIVTTEDRDLYIKSYRWVTVEEDGVVEDYPNARGPVEVGTAYVNRDDAFVEATEVQHMKGVGSRGYWLFNLVEEPGLLEVGEVVKVTIPELGFENGKYVLVAAFDERAFTFKGWG